MTKEEFNKLNIHEKVEYVNSNIKHFGSASKVCKSIGVNIETFRSSIKNIYTYIPYLQAYVKIDNLENGLEIAQENDSNGLIILDAQKHSQGIPSTTLTEIDDPQGKLIDLLNNYDKIKTLLENAQEHTQSIQQQHADNFMDLNMPNDNKLKKTTIRVNEQIWDEFKKCIDTEFNHLEQYDMISVALRDFVNKYSVLNK